MYLRTLVTITSEPAKQPKADPTVDPNADPTVDPMCKTMTNTNSNKYFFAWITYLKIKWFLNIYLRILITVTSEQTQQLTVDQQQIQKYIKKQTQL